MAPTANLPPKSIEATLKHRLLRSRSDPCYFNDMVLCRSPYWRAQREWAMALVDHRIVAVESGNGLGKGYLIGGLVPWFLFTRPDSLVYVCGAGQTQIGSVLFKEIRRAVQNSPFWQHDLLPMAISSGIKPSPATATVQQGWGAIGFSTSTIERASGHHARDMLVIVDEASGVPDEAWQAIDSLGFSKMLAAGNPLRADGKFAELCDQGDRDLLEQRPPRLSCRHFNVPSTESPHAHLDRSPFGLADKTWIEAAGRSPGVESPWYRAHVKAIRPKLAHDTLIQPRWLDLALSPDTGAAAAALRRGAPTGRIVLGCDVGEGVGKAQSVIIVRDDVGVLEIYASRFESKVQTADMICHLASKYHVPVDGIVFDGSGNTGRDIMKALERRYPFGLIPYFGSKPGGRFYVNARTACAAALARRLDPETDRGVARKPFHIPNGPHVQALFKELSELRYRLKAEKSELETKQDMMLRLDRSPDFADAICMTFRAEATHGI